MWYRKASGSDPSYEVKVITDIVDKALRDLFYKQLNYNPSDKELEAKKKILLKKIEEAKINIAKAQDKMEKNANKLKSTPEELKEGDLVLLDRKGLNWATEKNEDLKLKSKSLTHSRVLLSQLEFWPQTV
jgi:hypothetical protein